MKIVYLTFVPCWMNLVMDELVERCYCCRNHFQRIHWKIPVNEFERIPLKRKKSVLLTTMVSSLRILSFEFNDCSEETRPIGRRILLGLFGPLGGCGVLLLITSFGIGSGVSQSDTKKTKEIFPSSLSLSNSMNVTHLQ